MRTGTMIPARSGTDDDGISPLTDDDGLKGLGLRVLSVSLRDRDTERRERERVGCDERLKDKTEGVTRLPYTRLCGGTVE